MAPKKTSTTKKSGSTPASDPELARLLKLAESDPRAALAGAEKLRSAAGQVEAAAIRAALVAEQWFELRAAHALGIPRSTLQRKAGPELLAEAKRHRRAIGYTMGPRPTDQVDTTP